MCYKMAVCLLIGIANSFPTAGQTAIMSSPARVKAEDGSYGRKKRQVVKDNGYYRRVQPYKEAETGGYGIGSYEIDSI